jgi:hypothetical protein
MLKRAHTTNRRTPSTKTMKLQWIDAWVALIVRNGELHQVLPPEFHEGSQPFSQSLWNWDDNLHPLAAQEVARWGCPALYSFISTKTLVNFPLFSIDLLLLLLVLLYFSEIFSSFLQVYIHMFSSGNCCLLEHPIWSYGC